MVFATMQKGEPMDLCVNCGFNEDGYCTCPSADKWYACPIESEKPENIQTLKEYAEWSARDGGGA